MLQQSAHIAQPVTAGTYAADRRRSDPYLPAMREVAGRHLLIPTDAYTDCNLGSDLTTINGGALHIACRVRGHQYLAKYGDQCTIRDSRASGTETELAKILSGYGTHIVYGFAHAFVPGALAAWFVGDLNTFRRWYRREQYRTGQEPGCLSKWFADGTRFRSFRLDDLPPAFVIARQVA